MNVRWIYARVPQFVAVQRTPDVSYVYVGSEHAIEEITIDYANRVAVVKFYSAMYEPTTIPLEHVYAIGPVIRS